MLIIKALKIIISIIAVAAIMVLLLPFFMIMDMFIGMEPVIICVDAIILCLLLSRIVESDVVKMILGYLIFALMLGSVLYFAIKPSNSKDILAVIILTIVITFGIFFTRALKDVQFVGDKLIPILWFILIISCGFTFAKYGIFSSL